jgi:hypothetical protein
MKTPLIVAIILIALGVVAFGYQGLSYTSKEKIVDIGPLQVTADTTKTLPLPPIVGVIAIISGIVVLVVGTRKR